MLNTTYAIRHYNGLQNYETLFNNERGFYIFLTNKEQYSGDFYKFTVQINFYGNEKKLFVIYALSRNLFTFLSIT